LYIYNKFKFIWDSENLLEFHNLPPCRSSIVQDFNKIVTPLMSIACVSQVSR